MLGSKVFLRLVIILDIDRANILSEKIYPYINTTSNTFDIYNNFISRANEKLTDDDSIFLLNYIKKMQTFLKKTENM